VCPLDVQQCNGQNVTRVPPECEFPPCVCPRDVQVCNGETVSRVPPTCEFPPCVCPRDVRECPDGTVVSRIPPDCDFEDCPATPEPTASPTSVPTRFPTIVPTDVPTQSPTFSPTDVPAQPPTFSPTDVPTQSPTFSPTMRPSAFPTDSSEIPSLAPSPLDSSDVPSLAPSGLQSQRPSLFPTAATMRPTEEPFLNCSEYTHMMEVPGLEGVTVEYVVNMFPILRYDNTTNITFLDLPNATMINADNNTLHNATNVTIFGPPIISVRVTYEGQGWLAFAVSEAGSMVGSSAVIGVTNETTGMGNVGHYNLTSKSTPAYELFNMSTLMDANVSQDENGTFLEFTRFLEDDEGLPINGTGLNYFLVAHGTDNVLAYHGPNARSSFNLTLKPCTYVATDDFDDIYIEDLFIGDFDVGGEIDAVAAFDDESGEVPEGSQTTMATATTQATATPQGTATTQMTATTQGPEFAENSDTTATEAMSTADCMHLSRAIAFVVAVLYLEFL